MSAQYKILLVLSYVLVAVWAVAGWIYLTPELPGNHQAQSSHRLAFLPAITTLGPHEVLPKLKSDDGRPTLLYIYGTWCVHCHKGMPNIVDLYKEKKLDHVHMLFLSVDADANALDTYMWNMKYTSWTDKKPVFPPYVVEFRNIHALKDALQPSGSRFYTGEKNTGTPYFGLFDASGKLINEYAGVVSKAQIEKFSRGEKIQECAIDET
jgi:thiol-disulfide isomerase/thioredoxin